MAVSAAARMRPEWQEWHFVSPGEGRRCPNPPRSACGQSGSDFVSTWEGRRWPNPTRSACGQSGSDIS